MKLHYMGKYSGDETSLPHGEHQPGAVKFREPESSKKLALVANGIALVLCLITLPVLFLRGGVGVLATFWVGAVLALLSMFPHELLHGLCFRKDVYLYTNLKQGMLFVVGPETMTRPRFVWMSLLPNLLFGFLPFGVFLLFPQLTVLGSLGALALTMGAGDYLNVWNALRQMPKGAHTYLYGFHSYWYMPEK